MITEDSKTKGDWEAAYGADGGEVMGDKPFYPAYAQIVKGGQYYIWNPDSEEDNVLNKKGSDERLAACFYDRQFSYELFLKNGEHRVAIYFLDYNSKGRKQKVEVLDARNNAVLVSRSVSDFKDGKYLVYDMSGHLKIRITTEEGENSVLSGIFFGKNARNGPRKTRVAGELPKTPGFHKQRFYATVNGKKILVPYIAYIPEGYDKNEDKYPVLVHLHGAGEGGTDCAGLFNTGVPADFKNNEGLRKAMATIKGIVAVPVVGDEYTGKVKNIMDFGAFVEFMPGKEGLLHISEISWKRIEKMDGVLQTGEEVKVKLIEIDKKTGKYRLSRKALLPKPEAPSKEETSQA